MKKLREHLSFWQIHVTTLRNPCTTLTNLTIQQDSTWRLTQWQGKVMIGLGSEKNAKLTIPILLHPGWCPSPLPSITRTGRARRDQKILTSWQRRRSRSKAGTSATRSGTRNTGRFFARAEKRIQGRKKTPKTKQKARTSCDGSQHWAFNPIAVQANTSHTGHRTLESSL